MHGAHYVLPYYETNQISVGLELPNLIRGSDEDRPQRFWYGGKKVATSLPHAQWLLSEGRRCYSTPAQEPTNKNPSFRAGWLISPAHARPLLAAETQHKAAVHP